MTAAPTYPGHKAPCNGCGLCCKMELCPLAEMFLPPGSAAPCPALEFEEGRHWCGMVRRPHAYIKNLNGKPWADQFLQPGFAHLLGLGNGCDAKIDIMA